MLLLHLSDIHFRKDEVGTAMDPNASLRNELLLDAESMCNRLGKAPKAVLLSGDIAFAGDPSEYEYALSWLEDLCTRCGTSLSSVFVIPGNHDVVRKVASRNVIQALHKDIKNASEVALDGTIRGLLRDAEAGRLLYEALDPYNFFAQQFFCDLLPPERTIATRDLPLNDGSVLRLVGFNSAFVSSAADKKDDLFVDPACFQLKRERGVETLVMCHHPYNWLRQGDALRDHLNAFSRIHLFGHEHTSRIEPARDWVRVAASAAHPDRTESGWEPGYNLIELEVDGEGNDRRLKVAVHVRVWQTRPPEFRAKTDRGADAFRQEIRLDAWTPPVPAQPASPPQTASPAQADAAQGETPDLELARNDAMDTLRDISVRFFKLSLSQKSAIAGKLELLEDEDLNQPDFERFRRVFARAQARGKVQELDQEVKAASGRSR
ncbi:metallophosphoesterase [Methylobacterium iners]|uniref:3',5'-cyclic adenosine monophosphate phosphodiesterase CpdA n=1 Tax=Methylobacterium iners TaxID=418707 RepID=A0ABQ4S3E2_9HYPH|nr:metallophosphoesterase [Methylobacterium iners]GJD97658.1 3',5'-cyclic adenosine monophosphate phosphodiesterase CpdA [Methylobacterium iners]